MNHYAAIDVSLELSSVCIVDATGKVVKETKVETHPEALVKLFKDFGLPLTRIGLEAGPLSHWLYAGLTEAGFETTLVETRHVKAALSAMTVKTDRRDARGMAQLMRMGWFQPVHAKSPGSQGGARAAGRAQAAAAQAHRHRAQHPRHSPRFRPEGWPCNR
jgi:transposase